ncbi:MAG: ferredoxin family protein [Comamonadaceae bacterium]|nr:MAG: ferredoxin family protein [Comamonadaceae bacterium]
MTFVVTQACIACRYGECVSVCPQDAFREGPNFVAIDPQACANCGLCEMVCPVNAIVAERDLTADQRPFKELNTRLSKLWPKAVNTTALPDADQHAFETDKRGLLTETLE